MTDHASRWAWADVDLDAIASNIALLRHAATPAAVWAVVKADGYGHGAVEVSAAALSTGAAGLCVALASEGVALRAAGIDAPILVLSEQPADVAADLVAHQLIATASTPEGIDALGAAATATGRTSYPVHLKVDTGMHRVGAPAATAGELVDRIEHSPGLSLAGVYTHLAVADELQNSYTSQQLSRFDDLLRALRLPADIAVHAANSAATLVHPAARYSLVRAGIAIYGISPGAELDAVAEQLRPAMALKARVSYVKRLRAGDRISYGLRHTFTADANVATVPIGYADGVRRNLSGTGTSVLIRGTRREIVGTITMDQLMVDCDDDDVAAGDEVVLIGRQGDEVIRAEDWARRLGTIGYEIVCGIGARVPRRYVTSGGAGSRS
ncbi:MAG: alanine racemase [Acidimicrobiales bacterium]